MHGKSISTKPDARPPGFPFEGSENVYFTEEWLMQYLKKHPAAAERLRSDAEERGGRVQFHDTTRLKPNTSNPEAAEKRAKYGNRKTELDGRTFDSQHEAEVYARLSLEARAGEHFAVFCQVPFALPGGVKYVADFVTLEPDGTFTVYDAKSAATARDKVYRLKKRQMKACNNIEIREV